MPHLVEEVLQVVVEEVVVEPIPQTQLSEQVETVVLDL